MAESKKKVEIFKVNVKANLEAFSNKSRFEDVKDGETKIFRLAPSVREDGLLFYRVFQHWNLKDQDDNSIAVANLGVHGNEETGTKDYIEELSDVLLKHGNQMEQKIGKDLKGNNRYHAMGWKGKPGEDGASEFTFIPELKFLSVPKTAAQQTIEIIKKQQYLNEPTLDDSEKGQAVLVTRTGTGFATKYMSERSGQIVALDEIVPGWQDQLIKNLYDELNLKIYTRAVQKQLAQMPYPDLDWEKLEQEYGL